MVMVTVTVETLVIDVALFVNLTTAPCPLRKFGSLANGHRCNAAALATSAPDTARLRSAAEATALRLMVRTVNVMTGNDFS
jgi:hypothetical protein